MCWGGEFVGLVGRVGLVGQVGQVGQVGRGNVRGSGTAVLGLG